MLEGEKGEPARILLQKQFRPPVGKFCVEVPAGLIDEGESPEECAVSFSFCQGHRNQISGFRGFEMVVCADEVHWVGHLGGKVEGAT